MLRQGDRDRIDAAPDAGLAPQASARRRIANLLLRSVFAVIATLPLFWLPDNLEIGAFLPLLALCFAIAAIWLAPRLAWGVIAALVCIGAAALTNAIVLSLSLFGEGLGNYHVLNGYDGARLALALLGASCLLWHSIAMLRGRIEPP